MTDSQVFAVLQWVVDHCEKVPVVWRCGVYLALLFAIVTAVSVLSRRTRLQIPFLVQCLLILEVPVIALWRAIGHLAAWVVGVPADLLSRAAVEAAQKRSG